jgi:GAF domain-containing protein
VAVPVELRVQQGVRLYRQKSDTMQSALVGESLVLELISTGAPLTQVLDKLCIALNVQVGNVVSLVLSTDDAEHSEHAIAQSAAQLGLSLFSCTAILSLSEELLGTFEMYSCSPRTPTPGECRLIERATQLAALAIQRHYHEHDSGSWSTDWSGAIGKSSRERPPSKN